MNIKLMLFVRVFVIGYYLVGSSYDSKKSFAFSKASLWYSLVSCLGIFPTYQHIEIKLQQIYLEVSVLNSGQAVHIFYPEVLYCKHTMVNFESAKADTLSF